MHNAECTHLLLHSQKAEQRLVRLFVQSQDALPVLAIRLLLLQAVQGKERRVESRQQQREEQRGAAHHHNTARQRREREGEGRFYFNGTVMDKLKKIKNVYRLTQTPVLRGKSPLLFYVSVISAFRWGTRGVRDDATIIWQPRKQKPAGNNLCSLVK